MGALTQGPVTLQEYRQSHRFSVLFASPIWMTWDCPRHPTFRLSQGPKVRRALIPTSTNGAGVVSTSGPGVVAVHFLLRVCLRGFPPLMTIWKKQRMRTT